MTRTARHLHLLAATGKIRTAQFDGRDHIVVPVVALVEGVIWPMGAKCPELVLAEEFSVAPGGWDGRPVMMNHPSISGQPVSANSPEVLEASCFGTVFNTTVSGKRLLMEAWLDPIKAARIGGDAQRTIERVQAGEMIEISVGTLVVAEEKKGSYNGKPYGAIWRELTPDHLALLPEGVTGACSNAMGCGTPRAATVHLVTAEGLREVTPMSEPTKPRGLRERMKDLFRSAVKGFNQTEVRSEIREALKGIEPLYAFIEDIWETDEYVIYCVYCAVPGGQLAFHNDGYPMEPYTTKMYRRDFSMDANGVVTFGDSRTEVEAVVYFEAVTAAEGRAACSCGRPSKPTTAAAPTQEGETMERQARIAALMANPHSPVKEEAALKALTDDGLTAIETTATTLKAAADKAAADATAAAEAEADRLRTAAAPKQAAAQSEEEYLAAAPAAIRDTFTRMRSAENALKSELVKKLSTAQSVYTEAQLKALSLGELEKIAALAKVEVTPVDYSGRFAGSNSASEGSESDVYSKPPDGYRAALDAQKGAGK